ncbi:MAG: penicillin-binding protein 2 [Endomicrobiales bacterium]|nr:penicillin-binding protein 2 [Endomicrobiales bacterium]
MVRIFRLIIPFVFILASFIMLSVRLFFIQIWHHDELNMQVNKTVYKTRPELPCRGMIRDRNGKILAMSIETYTLFADANLIHDVDEVYSKLGEVNIEFPKELVLSSNKSFIPIKEDLNQDTVKKIRSWKFPGLGFKQKYLRKYTEENMASHLLGMVGRDGIGLEGAEYAFNAYLSGEKVKKLKYRDGQGREISEKLYDFEKSQGADVYLSIDKNLQFIAEQEVEKAYSKTKAKKAIVIIQDPNTGEILALACRPDYNPEDFSGSWENLRNPAISDVFEPGSTFKVVTAAAALEEKLVKRSEVIWCEEGKYKVFDHTIRDHEKRGLLTFDQVIEYSSNIGTLKIGNRLGKDNLYKYIRQFGFYSKTGIGLPGEARGLLKHPDKWSGLSLPVISFGQEVGVTAIQIINAYSSIANGGVLLKPTIIKEIRGQEGELISSCEKNVVRRVISDQVADEIKSILTGVVERGTGQHARIKNYSVAGKTGTAQKRDPETNTYSLTAYISSFCGFLPVSDPKLTILVIIDEPQGDYWASSVATPVFYNVAKRSIQYLRIKPDQETLYLADVKK